MAVVGFGCFAVVFDFERSAVLAWIVFSLLSVDSAAFTATVVMLGTPTAVSTFVFATELGGDKEFASLNVFLTTLVSIGTLFVLITLVS